MTSRTALSNSFTSRRRWGSSFATDAGSRVKGSAPLADSCRSTRTVSRTAAR